jgi:hypothetical protein
VFSFSKLQLCGWDYIPRPPQDTHFGTVVLDNDVEGDSQRLGDGSELHDVRRSELLFDALAGMPQKLDQLEFDFSPSIDLFNGKARSIWEPVLLSTMFFLLCCAGLLGYRSLESHARAETVQQEMVSNFKKLFPDKRINGPIEAILEEELKSWKRRSRLLSHSEMSSKVLTNLTNFLKGIPDEMAFELDSIELREESVTLEGSVKGFDDFQVLKQGFLEEGFKIRNDTAYGSPFTLKLFAETANSRGIK